MAKLRVGFGSDFNITGQKVGLGTANPTALLEVAETAKADFNITGVTTLTSYGGFVAQNQNITEPTVIKRTTSKSGTLDSVNERETEFTELGSVGNSQSFNTLSEDLVVEEGKIFSIHNTEMVGSTTIGEQDPHTHASHVSAGSLEQVSVTGHFSVPCGGINERQETPIEGTVRFNTDLNTLEFFNGNEWRQFTYNQGQSGRGVFMAGFNPGFDLSISYINISSRGNTQNFGEVTPNMGGGCAGLGNATRGLVAGGFAPSYHDVIEYITIAAGGNSIDFGNLTDARRYASGASSSTRGVFAGGYSPGVVNVIDYVEITTIGNALDFGDLSEHGEAMGTATSPTRACFGGQRHPQTDEFIDFITIASTGNATDFGDLSQARGNKCYHTSSSSTRGIFGGGIIPAQVNTIDYITIAATGNAIDFGDLTVNRRLGFNVSTQTRAVFAGGYNNVTSMDYVTIATAGDAIDFGEITSGQLFSGGACSDSHGGLGGF
jgi:hypothetical protein